MGVITCENKIGPGNPQGFTIEDETRLREISRLISLYLPDWERQDTLIRKIDERLRRAYRDRIHNVRGAIYTAAYWGLDDMLKRWHQLKDRDKRREVKRVMRTINGAVLALEGVESQIVARVAEDRCIGPALRVLAAEYHLDRCTSFEGCINEYRFEDLRFAYALFTFGQEALSNARKYSKVGRHLRHQIHVRLDVDDDEMTLSVLDHGVGLPEELGPNAFEMLKHAMVDVGGWFEHSPGPKGRGTCVVAHIPMNGP